MGTESNGSGCERPEDISEVCQKGQGNLNSHSWYFKEGKGKGKELKKKKKKENRGEREEMRNWFEWQLKSSRHRRQRSFKTWPYCNVLIEQICEISFSICK